VDAGRPGGLLAGETAFDLARVARILDGNNDGVARRDQGAYEHRFVPPVPPLAKDTVRPSVTSARFRPKRFRAGRKSTKLVSSRKKRAPRGSKLTFKLSEAGTARIGIERAGKGRRSKGKCRRPTAKLRKKPRCKRWKRVATLRRGKLKKGTVTVRFSGRLRGKALRAGSYRAVIGVTDGAGNRSRLKRAGFRIVR
jgi:hypothetical protein